LTFNNAPKLPRVYNVPVFAREMELIIEMQIDEFWFEITPDLLEGVRKRLSGLT